MSPERNQFDAILNQIQHEEPETAAVESAAARVWDRISSQTTQPGSLCDQFRPYLKEFRAGTLPEAKRTLVQDHLHECVACRRAAEGKVAVMPRLSGPVIPAASGFPWRRWAIAAVVISGAGVSAWFAWEQYGGAGVAYASVQSIDGILYAVDSNGSHPVKAGEQLAYGAELRTALASAAVLQLGDGSQVELGERSSLNISRTRQDLTLNLALGNVIVQAAKRGAGHLYVATRDCKVAVTGTVFSVQSAVKGSRVSVVEGEVHVAQNGADHVLKPGEQYSSSVALTPVPVEQEVSWSRNRQQYTETLRALAKLHTSLEQVRLPDLRYSSKFLDRMPANTAVYISIPNLSQALTDAEQIIEKQTSENPALKAWTSQNGMRDVVGKLRAIGEYLGDEIVIAARLDGRRLSEPVVLAEIRRPGLQQFLDANNMKMPLRVDDNLVSIGARQLQASDFAGGGFTATPFGAKVALAYRNGAGLLFAFDLESVMGGAGGPGAPNLKHLIVEQKQVNGYTGTHADLTFNGVRTGVASWLAKPMAMGVLDFITPEATFVSAFVVKSPAAIVDQIMSWEKGRSQTPTFEKETGLSLRDDLAAPLGAEFVVAFDGPAIPTPSWKFAVEVYDANRLQYALQKLAESSKGRMTLSQEAASGRTYYTLKVADMPLGEAHYVFNNGYLVAAPNRALLDRALQYRASGYSLPRSQQFISLLPRDQHGNFSAMVYYNVGDAIGQLIQKPGIEMKPTLLAAYAGDSQVTFAASGSILGMSMNQLMMLQAPQMMMSGNKRAFAHVK